MQACPCTPPRLLAARGISNFVRLSTCRLAERESQPHSRPGLGPYPDRYVCACSVLSCAPVVRKLSKGSSDSATLSRVGLIFSRILRTVGIERATGTFIHVVCGAVVRGWPQKI